MWVNVNGHTERAGLFLNAMYELSLQLVRYPAMLIENPLHDADEFVVRTRRTRQEGDPSGYYEVITQYQPTAEKLLSTPSLQREYAATYSLARTIPAALRYGLSKGWPRWLLFEDDVVPRLDTILESPPPPKNAEIAVWGGALKRANVRRDESIFMGSKTPQWVQALGRDQRYFAHAYEVTQAGALALLDAYDRHFMTADTTWWYAFDMVPSFVLEPQAFVQVGESTRTRATRKGITHR